MQYIQTTFVFMHFKKTNLYSLEHIISISFPLDICLRVIWQKKTITQLIVYITGNKNKYPVLMMYI